VLAALVEFDAIGREAFLSKYGFRSATDYFVLHEGRLYDSKAIAGAAHGCQHGTALRAKEFSGGAATVAARLNSLGFLVTVPSGPKWALPIGAETTRTEVTAIYGGGKYGGIEPSAQSNNILVYTDPTAGSRHSYFDGWGCERTRRLLLHRRGDRR
jgi:5-methylcytosine-specific restriction enzyme A